MSRRITPVEVSVTVSVLAGVTLALQHSAGHVLSAVDGHAVVGGEGVTVTVAVLSQDAALEVVNSVSYIGTDLD